MTFIQIYVLNRFLLYAKLYKANVNSKYLKREFTNFLWCREMATATCSEGGGTPKQVAKNRLANEKSPYLLQHATNPVNWYPWCQEALDKAKEENKLIFLSIGYSTCHWCHVMEKESFERQEIGDIMNMHYVNIKVDREERPDVDKVYMTYVQATTGSGGWPLSVWLTPNLNPIYGGTYFPTGDRHYGKPGFKTILLAIAEKWQDQKEKIEESSEAVMKILGKEISLADEPGADIPELTCVQKCFDILSKTYDHKFGGFGKSPKFPQAVTFTFLFRYYAQNPGASNNINAKDMCLHTLRCMAKGGIHDHIAKGFHRYSTDEEWHVPHFEKMLYDQAQLALIYSVAYQITKERIYGDVARGILMYVTRDLTDPNDGFYSAEDADSYPTGDSEQKKEGAFCVWTRNEVEKLLNFPLDGNPRQKVYEAFCMYFDVRENGNVHPYQDPHEELKSKNVLMIRHEKEKVAKEFGLSLEQLKANLMHACGILYEARLKRPKPHRDDKMIAAWNGLMISGFVKAGQMLNEKEYIVRAIKAANFIKNNLYKPEMKTLLRSCYRGEDGNIKQIENPIEGFSDDYAFVIQGLLDLYEGCGNYKWLEWAEELQNKQDELFWDSNANGYFMTSGQDSSVVLRMKEDQDGAEPSSNSVSLMNLFRLSAFLGENIYHKKAEAILSTFNDRLNRVPHALPQMLCGVMFYHQKMRQIVIAATRDSKDTHTMVEVVHSFYIPNKVLMFADGDTEDNFLYKRLPLLSSMIPINNQATAYICEGTSCSLPVTSPTALRSILDPHRQKLQ